MVDPKRIPAKKTEAFTAWAMPAISSGQVVEVERSPSNRVSGDSARPVATESFDKLLVENIKAGTVPSRLTAGQLEAIAKQAYQEGYEAGYREGYKESYQEGYARSLEDAQETIAQRIARLDNLLNALLDPLADHQRDLEESISQLTIALTRGVIKRELELGSSQIEPLVTEALNALPAGAKGIRVFVCAEDYKLLTDCALQKNLAGAASDAPGQSLSTALDTVGKWQLAVDDLLQPGDCRVLTRQSVVDYCVSDRLTQLMEQFLTIPDEP